MVLKQSKFSQVSLKNDNVIVYVSEIYYLRRYTVTFREELKIYFKYLDYAPEGAWCLWAGSVKVICK